MPHRHRVPVIAGVVFVASLTGPARPGAAEAKAQDVKITVLSTMLADHGIGEWGFAALVEVDGYRVLFDTGAREDTSDNR